MPDDTRKLSNDLTVSFLYYICAFRMSFFAWSNE